VRSFVVTKLFLGLDLPYGDRWLPLIFKNPQCCTFLSEVLPNIPSSCFDGFDDYDHTREYLETGFRYLNIWKLRYLNTIVGRYFSVHVTLCLAIFTVGQ
jgi:hypothetical protein